MEPFYFRKLDVYQNSKSLSKLVCRLLKKYPIEERFALCAQLRRAVMSISINIAEGFGRFSSKEKAHFIEIAFGSLTEVLCEMELSFEEGYISQEDFTEVEGKLIIISKQLSGLHASIIRNGDSIRKTI
ncbi:S23 ribosomal protein [Hoylesella oralis ATCC 33269]|uniref:S23 ribosomal protein n=1 Tax=Hoylesella oralis ATCC 33269 TaxID=873533 RepID=E7RMW0_9BACT|nr:four helix bundle protein [Hoylesella oralis]EFZ38091.1 S23 ribosomal protein [Hoylesella oralis ATCC 33269]EPH16454.1 four helix bundle protein [Hoylesella oralis HGA0225]SHF38874.1 four helix bundle protein [Hoylesella oralis]